jgi:hypothetical protein
MVTTGIVKSFDPTQITISLFTFQSDWYEGDWQEDKRWGFGTYTNKVRKQLFTGSYTLFFIMGAINLYVCFTATP